MNVRAKGLPVQAVASVAASIRLLLAAGDCHKEILVYSGFSKTKLRFWI
jgi:hypothetical protein